MSGELKMMVVAGFDALVIRPDSPADAAGRQGIGATAVEWSGVPSLAVTLRHVDGTLLTVVLDEAGVHRLADLMADFVDALPTMQSEVRH